MSRKAALAIFDEVISGTTGASSPTGDIVVYTDARFNDVLAQFDRLAIEGIADQCSIAAMAYRVYLSQSNDGRNWVTKSLGGTGGSLYERTAMTTTGQFVDVGSDPGTTPTLALVRLEIHITAPLSQAQSMHLKLMACLRDDS